MSCWGDLMKKIFDPERVARAVALSRYRDILDSLPVRLFLIEYEDGEFVSSPDAGQGLFQILTDGSLRIYFIRSDGSSYSLAVSERDDFLGETEFFHVENRGVYAQAVGKLRCLAFAIEENREGLLRNADLMRLIAQSLTMKMEAILLQNTASSLQERVISFMRYRCQDRCIRGVERAAFQLHCSPRQLQRILNAFEEDGVVCRIGKGSYELRR